MKQLLGFACGLACLVALGCGGGPKMGSVTGKVTMDDKPLSNVLVTFTPDGGEGRPATGTTDASGQYTLVSLDGKGAVVGKYKVSLKTLPPAVEVKEVRSDDPSYAAQASGSTAADYKKAEFKETIPAKYNTETEITKEVTSGSNVIDLELTSS